MKQGLIEVLTGDGKGKTTASVGLAIRAAGADLKVVFAQFLKDSSSCEIAVLNKIDGIRVISCEKLFGFIKYMDEDTLARAKQYYQDYYDRVVGYALENDVDVLILDEFMAAYNFDMIDKEKAFAFIKSKPEGMELVLTGRDVPSEIAQFSDYISNIQKVKHPYDNGVGARLGIEL